jgi:molybdate transport system permease protein
VDWTALLLSLQLSFWTMLVLLPVGIWMGRRLTWTQMRSKSLLEALVALPLVLPPTVLGFYLLVAMGAGSPVGRVIVSPPR